jgi:hypothetical protein
MRMFEPAITTVAFTLFFGVVFFASFALTATLQRSFAPIAVTPLSPG